MTATLLAFDFGQKRLGVAVGNAFLKQAQPLTVITAESNQVKFDAIAALLSLGAYKKANRECHLSQ